MSKHAHPWWHYFFTEVDRVETTTILCFPRIYETRIHMRCSKCKVKWSYDPDEKYEVLDDQP